MMDKDKNGNEMVEVELELDNDVFMNLAMDAHRRDITINELVSIILKDVVEQEVLKEELTDTDG